MPTTRPNKIDEEKGLYVVVIGGASKGGSGYSISPSGKVRKIPSNNPFEKIATLAEKITLTTDVKLKAQLERNMTEAVAVALK